MNCVKRVAEFALQSGINTLVDIDLTDLFFNVYRHKDYFDIDSYIPEKFKMYMIHGCKDEEPEFAERLFNKNYSSPVYGFTDQLNKRK